MQPGFETVEECTFEVFGLSVGLGMANRGEALLDLKIFAPSLEGIVSKLLAIIRDDYRDNSKRQTTLFQKNF